MAWPVRREHQARMVGLGFRELRELKAHKERKERRGRSDLRASLVRRGLRVSVA